MLDGGRDRDQRERSLKSPPKATDLAPEALRARLRRWLFARVLIVTVFLGAVAASHVSSNSDPSFPLRGIAAQTPASRMGNSGEWWGRSLGTRQLR